MLVEIILAVSVVLTLFFWIKHHKLRVVINKLPGYSGLPFIGNSLHIKSDTLGFFNQVIDLCREHAGTGIAKFWFGPEPMIWVYKADLVEELMNSSKHTKKAFTYTFFQYWLGDGLLNSYGPKWLARRRMITPTFHFKILEQFAHIFNEQARVLVGLFDEKIGGPGFDIQPYIYRCMLDIICETAMGVKVDAQKSSDSNFVRAIYRNYISNKPHYVYSLINLPRPENGFGPFSVLIEGELLLQRMKYPWLWNDRLYRLLPVGREDTACLKELHGFTRKVIAERMQELKSKSNTVTGDDVTAVDEGGIYSSGKRRRLAFIDMLLETSRTDPSLTLEGVQEEVDTFMFEGHDTTATGAVFLLYMLACYPELQVKVQQEIDLVLGGDDRDVTIEDVSKLKYIECFIKETFRLYPPVPWFGRTTTEPCTIGEYSIPEGMPIFVFSMMLHRDPNRFPHPEKFDPDRWLDDSTATRHPYCYVPFSAGIRNCIGQRFALLEEKTVLCHLMRNFTVSTKSSRDDVVPMSTLILKPSVPLLLEFTRR